jgi:hypothetical protein
LAGSSPTSQKKKEDLLGWYWPTLFWVWARPSYLGQPSPLVLIIFN